MTFAQVHEQLEQIRRFAATLSDRDLERHLQEAHRAVSRAEQKGAKVRGLWRRRIAVYGDELKKRTAEAIGGRHAVAPQSR